ncbi:MAG: hypothetical protein JST96_19155, partial [Bacteroidetes bacterium]|nr:hypothetical protein [Bacteroidota bacterium]
MSENGKHINYTSADIQKYLEGKLSAQEMHAIEKAAIDDPFLADAIEGFENLSTRQSTAATNADIHELHQQLQERISGKKKSLLVFFTGWRVAAAVIVLLGIGVLTVNYILNSSKSRLNIAQSQQVRKELDSLVQNKNNVQTDSTESSRPDSSRRAITETNNSPKDIAVSKTSTQKEKKSSLVVSQTEPAVRKKEITGYKKDDVDLAKNIKPGFHFDSIRSAPLASADVDKALAGKVAGAQISANKARVANTNFLTGKVVDANNQPVIGASVFIKNKKYATVT